MRTLLILQSAIIAAGAYYIFTLAHTSDRETFSGDNETASQIDIVATTTITSSVDRNDEMVEDVSTADMTSVSVGNDIGMEFPIPDSDIAF